MGPKPEEARLTRVPSRDPAEEEAKAWTAYDAILAPATTNGKNIMPRVAALLDVMQISEISKVVAPDTFERPVYAGNAYATCSVNTAVQVVSVRQSEFAAAEP